MEISQPYSKTQSFAVRFILLYVLLFISSFSFPHALIPDIGSWFSPFYEKLVRFTAEYIFHLQKPYSAELISDSTGMYIHAFNLIFISGMLAAIWFYFDKQKKKESRLFAVLQIMVRYYLAMQLLNYGFNKIFKWQFYLPEPNTLFTTVGETHRDLLYWTSMGSSYSYTFFSGFIEIFAAAFLFFRRTQLFGALISLGILINVFMINIGFDISVKLYSAFLILLCCILIAPDAKRLLVFFFKNEIPEKKNKPPVFISEKYRWLFPILKTLVVLFLLTDSLYIYFETENYNDDLAKRPPLHGAYEVSSFVLNGDTLQTDLTEANRWKRVFVHRRDYFIVQNMQDQMTDFRLENDTVKHILLMSDYSGKASNYFHYVSGNENTLLLSGKIGDKNAELILNKIDLKQQPLLVNEFSWTVDE